MKTNKYLKYRNSAYGWIVSGLLFGLWMFLCMNILLPWAQNEPFSQIEIVKGLAWWLGVGLLMELTKKFYKQDVARKELKKTDDKKTS